MKAKENALRIINFDHPERVAYGVPHFLLQYRGANHEGYEGGGHDCPVGTAWTDIWGTGWHKEQPGVMGFPRSFPLAEMDALRRYSWPDPDDERICGQIHRLNRGRSDDWFLAGSHRDTLWEKAYMLVGMENMMVYFHTEPGYAREILHRIMDFQLGLARHYLDCGVELIQCTDDLGTQRGLLLSPAVIEEFLLPEYRRLFDLYRARGVLIDFHSCGRIGTLLETFIGLGVNILNPIQATANDLDEIRAVTQGRLALRGGVSSAVVMEGPAERIHAEVRRRLRQLGQAGGYFCEQDQGMPYPPAHIEAVREAVERYGSYPLQ